MVITYRLCSFVLALVIAASSLFPAAAWGKDSFISGGEQYEPSSDAALSDDLPVPDIYAAPRCAPGMIKVSAADQAAAEANTTGKLVVPATFPSSADGTFQAMSKYYFKSSAGGVRVENDYWRDVIGTFTISPYFASRYIYLFRSSFIYNPDISDPLDMVRGVAVFCDKSSGVFPSGYSMAGSGGGNIGTDSWEFTLSYDVSAYSASAFSLDGVDTFCSAISGPYWPSWVDTYPLSVSVLVDGQQVLTLSRGSTNYIDFGGYVYSGSAAVSTISFRWVFPFTYFVSADSAYAGTYTAALYCAVNADSDSALTISFLDGQDVINIQNDKTKSDINKHEEYESQWTGSMTDNFNALGFDSFSWGDSLVSGFSIFSGIFMDIWRALGGATILFTFPLLLGVALLLIGRISRSGGRSGSGKGGGDGG